MRDNNEQDITIMEFLNNHASINFLSLTLALTFAPIATLISQHEDRFPTA